MAVATMDKDTDAEAPAAGDAPPKKKRGLKKLLLMAGVPVLLLGGGGGAYVAGVLDPLIGGGAAEAEAGAEVEAAEAAPVAVVFYDLPDLLVNLNTTSRQSAFLKIQVALELNQDTDVAALEQLMPRIIDSFQIYLRELRPEELKGSEGVYRLKEELLVRVNQAAAPVHVNDVLFKSVLVQ